MFTLDTTTPLGRRGRIQTAHGTIETPFFMPVGTTGAMRGISHDLLCELGAQILLCNTYHLMLRPSMEVIDGAGGLHSFIGWRKPILTDSGGFQVFSLEQNRSVSDAGATFRSHLNGDEHFLGPEEAMRIQHTLGADIIMCFDECPPSTAARWQIEQAVDRTLKWARTCKQVHEKLVIGKGRRRGEEGAEEKNTGHSILSSSHSSISSPLLFGIVQGGLHFDLRKKCAEELIAIGFDGYALGGLAVGEGEEEMIGIVREIAPLLPGDKPRYLMGVGEISQLRRAVALGIDMFDCVLPVRHGRHGRVFLSDGSAINIMNTQYRDDHSVIDADSPSALGRRHTKSYLRHLLDCHERYGEMIAISQNLGLTLEAMRRLREEMGG